ncbi:MAG: O-antigen translocase [Muribaculaceae bacterium]|nr:O-antigen translocase [Muribaculaceae bacterium]MDE6754644.1 O-antigen translocase [Muribaculaceae bacterium]
MAADKESNSYKSILKGISLFGGVKVFEILINLIRGKFVALFLGPEGMGISSMFTSASSTIQRFASLGLNMAIVKEVAADRDDESRNRILEVCRRLVSLTALAGAVICALFASPLSRITFGSDAYTWQFFLLAAGIYFSIEGAGRLSLLQGLHKIKDISRASVIGALAGLLVGVPLYYFFRDKGIVPAIVLLSLTLLVAYDIPVRKYSSSRKDRFSWKESKTIVRHLIILGIFLMANDLFCTLASYLINIFIRQHGSETTVGLYQAANSITNQYSGLVFAALAMDYFPRLSNVASDNSTMRDVVNRQTEVVALVIAPAATLLILSAPLAIRILLTTDFLPIVELMRWMGLGILIRALSMPMAYISFAKGNKKLFFWMEGVGCNILTLVLSCGFFYYFGLMGLGYALVADNALCLIIYYFINHNLYEYRFTPNSLLFILLSIIFGILSFVSSFIPTASLAYLSMSLSFIISLLLGIKVLRKYIKK